MLRSGDRISQVSGEGLEGGFLQEKSASSQSREASQEPRERSPGKQGLKGVGRDELLPTTEREPASQWEGHTENAGKTKIVKPGKFNINSYPVLNLPQINMHYLIHFVGLAFEFTGSILQVSKQRHTN